eukprot:UN11511
MYLGTKVCQPILKCFMYLVWKMMIEEKSKNTNTKTPSKILLFVRGTYYR